MRIKRQETNNIENINYGKKEVLVMLKRKDFRFYTVAFLVVFMAIAMTCQWAVASELKGRDFVRLGKVSIMEGSLVRLNTEEWALKVGDTSYDLHMGPSSFRDYHKFVLKEGGIAKVKGYVYNNDVGVMEIETGGQSIALRDEAGRPAWAGSRFSKGGASSRTADSRGFSDIGNVPAIK